MTGVGFLGVTIGIVTNNRDPDRLGRVKVALPWLADDVESAWARVLAPAAGRGRGFYFLPEVDDEVLVAFEQGDPACPYVLGALWNGRDAPPETNADGRNDVRVIRSRSGHMIRLVDASGEEKIEIVDSSGRNRIVVNSADGTVTVAGDADVVVEAAKGTLTLRGKDVAIRARQGVTVEGATVTVKAQARLTVKGQIVEIN
ncbi:MAG: phage baseplate assembly protein V [Pseudonocardia sp.]